MDPVWALRQIAFQLERAGAPTYRVRAFRRAAAVVVSGLPADELTARLAGGTLQQLAHPAQEDRRLIALGLDYDAVKIPVPSARDYVADLPVARLV